MKAVWKYELTVGDRWQDVTMPKDARIVHVGTQGDDLDYVYFWAEVSLDAPMGLRRFVVVGTGHQVPYFHQYVGTAACAGGALVWHVYEEMP